jgi:cobalt-zinc-cadmium efflux system membrane fusion protein
MPGRADERHQRGRGARCAFAIAWLIGGVTIGAMFPLPGTTPRGSHAALAQDARQAAEAVAPRITLTEKQMRQMYLGKVEPRIFQDERTAFGQITFDEDLTTPVFPPYAGRVIRLDVKPGSPVKKGDPLFEIDSPDLVQAEGTLTSAAGVLLRARSQLDLTTRALTRQRDLYQAKGAALKDVEQAEADRHGAESDYRAAVGALAAARDAVRIFGKTDAQITRIQEERRIDPVLPVNSPIAGTVIARNAGPGQLVQPSNSDPVYLIADLSKVWLIANVAELDVPAMQLGDQVEVHVAAYPNQVFHARITNIGAMVDPATRRVTVRSEVETKGYQLKSQMFASFRIVTDVPNPMPAIPSTALVRDGSLSTVWVMRGPREFEARRIERGVEQSGMVEILSGLSVGETVVVEGAVFLSNASDIVAN